MKDKHDLGLSRTPEIEMKDHFSYLTKTTSRYKKIISDLIIAGYEIQKKKKVTEKQWKLFEEGVRKPYEVVFCHLAGDFLCRLSYNYKQAEEIFIRLSHDKDSMVRFNNLTNLLRWPNKKIIDIVLKNGLNDKSTRVRGKTGDVIDRLQLKRYSRILPAYIEREENAKVKESLKYGLYWITHDFKLNRKDKYGYDVWIKTATGMMGLTLNEKQYKNIDKVIKAVRKDWISWEKNLKL